jgi:hypothetical protein
MNVIPHLLVQLRRNAASMNVIPHLLVQLRRNAASMNVIPHLMRDPLNHSVTYPWKTINIILTIPHPRLIILHPHLVIPPPHLVIPHLMRDPRLLGL